MVCPMPRYSANSFTLSNAFSIKLRCHVSALPLSTSFFPYYFALRYVTMGVLIWLFLSAKGSSGIARISPITFYFLLFFSFVVSFFLLFRLGFFCPWLPVGGIFFHVFHIKLSCRRVPYFLIDGVLFPFFFFSGCD